MDSSTTTNYIFTPAVSSSEAHNILTTKREVLGAVNVDSSLENLLVDFVPTRDCKFIIETRCPRIATLLRGISYLEERPKTSFRGVSFLPMLDKCSDKDILEELQSCNQTSGIIKVERLTNGKFILTFSNSLPSVISCFGRERVVKQYYSSPFRCTNCQAFGHRRTWCKQTARCCKCSQAGHIERDCKNTPNCRTCKMSHRPDSPNCPKWQQEIRLKKLMARDNIPYNQAKKSMEEKTASVPATKATASTRTWAKVASKSVGTVRPRHVATQTTTKVSIGIQVPDPIVLVSTSTTGTQTDLLESSDIEVQSSPQIIRSLDTPSQISQSSSPRGGHVSSRGRGRGGRGGVQRGGIVRSIQQPPCPSSDSLENDLSLANSLDDICCSPSHSLDVILMDSTSESSKRRRSGSDSSSVENSKKFSINRTFRKTQVDGHHDHEFSSDEESATSHQAEESARYLFNPPVVSDNCLNCHGFLERRFVLADPERISFIIDKTKDVFYSYFCHPTHLCPFLDLKQYCQHCFTPGKFLKGGIHFYSQLIGGRQCLCCSDCSLKNFFNGNKISNKRCIEFFALVTIAHDQEIDLNHSYLERFTAMFDSIRSELED